MTQHDCLMLRASCFLCGDLADRGGRIVLGAGLALTSDIAPLAPGHMLIHPVDHLGSFAYADKAQLETWWNIVQAHISRLEPYTHVLMFEHGTDGLAPTDIGCTDHAHIHLLPVPESAAARLNALDISSIPSFGRRGDSLQFSDLYKLRGLNYFWVAQGDVPIVHSMDIDQAERQILRRIVAEALGITDHETWNTFDLKSAQDWTSYWAEKLGSSEGTV